MAEWIKNYGRMEKTMVERIETMVEWIKNYLQFLAVH